MSPAPVSYGWGSGRPLAEQLFAEGHRFDFYQAVRLLERLNPGAVPVGEGSNPEREAVRFESALGFGFPASEIAEISHAVRGQSHRTRRIAEQPSRMLELLAEVLAVAAPEATAALERLKIELIDYCDGCGGLLTGDARELLARSGSESWPAAEERFRRHLTPKVQLAERLLATEPRIGELLDEAEWRAGEEAAPHLAELRRGFEASADTIALLHHGSPAAMRVSFLSLGGASGPLPTPYSEFVIQRTSRGDRAPQAFLDLFTHRMVSLMHRARKLHRVGLDGRPPAESSFSRYLFSLIGLGTEGLAGRLDVSDQALLSYAGLLAQRPRSAVGLSTLVREHFKVEAEVEQFVGGWLQLEPHQRTLLGRQNHSLGRTALAGSKVWEQGAGFELNVKPKDLRQFLEFLPNGSAWRPLTEVARLFAGEALDFSVHLELDGSEVPRSALGPLCGTRLGWSSWLGTRPREGATYAVRLRPQRLVSGLERLRQNLPLLTELSPREFSALVRMMRVSKLPAQHFVVREGEAAESLFFVTHGSVRLLSRGPEGTEVPLATVGAGRMFGESALMPDTLHQASAVTLEDSELLELTERGLARAMERFPAFERAVEIHRREHGEEGEGKAAVSLAVRKLYALGTDLLAGLSLEGVAEVAGEMMVRRLPENVMIIRQGEVGRSLFIIAKGAVKVERAVPGRAPEVVELLRTGEFFGEMALLSAEPRAASVITVTPTVILELTKESLARTVARYPPVERALKVFFHPRMTTLQ